MLLRELKVSYAPVAGVVSRPSLATPAETARLLFTLLDPEPTEVFGVLLLTTRFHVLAWSVVGRGSLNSVVVEPREVFRTAMLGNAASIIAAHNHPSGDPTPSPDDMEITRRLTAAGQVIGIHLLDHVIVGNETGKYFSFKESGRL